MHVETPSLNDSDIILGNEGENDDNEEILSLLLLLLLSLIPTSTPTRPLDIRRLEVFPNFDLLIVIAVQVKDDGRSLLCKTGDRRRRLVVVVLVMIVVVDVTLCNLCGFLLFLFVIIVATSNRQARAGT